MRNERKIQSSDNAIEFPVWTSRLFVIQISIKIP